MVTWIVVAAVVFALVVLVLAVRPLVARMPGLTRAAQRLVERQRQAEALQTQADALAGRIAAVQESMIHAQEQRAVNRAARGEKDDHPPRSPARRG